jgi:hypothetical protein
MQGQGAQARAGAQGQTGVQGKASGRTGIDNVTYDLISVAYHALQAAQTYQQYERDAQRGDAPRGGDDQFVDFFRRACDTNRQCAHEAIELLGQCLGGQGTQGSDSEEPGMYGRGTR